MKKRTLGLIIAGVAAASMIGTGFAAWVITGNAQETANGQFNVETVSEKTVTINYEFDEDVDDINFLAPSTKNNTKWLTSDSSVFENLEVTLNVTFTPAGDANAADFKVKYEFDYSSIEDAIAANYITAPVLTVNETTYTNGAYLNLEDLDKDTNLTITFGWGTAFGGVNPYEHYNALDNTPENRADASTKLADLYDKVNGEGFTVVITAEPKTA